MPKSQKSLKFTPTPKGVLVIFDFSPFRVGAKKLKIAKTVFYRKTLIAGILWKLKLNTMSGIRAAFSFLSDEDVQFLNNLKEHDFY